MELRPLFAVVPKAKTAKIVRNVIDVLATVSGFDQLQVELCQEQVAWAKEEKRTFLRHRVELRLSTLYLDMKNYPAALKVRAVQAEHNRLTPRVESACVSTG